MKKNVIAITLFALLLSAFPPQRAQAQIQEANLYSLEQKQNANIEHSGIFAEGTPNPDASNAMAVYSGFYEYQDVYIVDWTNNGSWDSPENIGPIYDKNGKRSWPNFANGPEYIGNNIASIKTNSRQTVYILTWRNASWLTFGSVKTRLLIIRPNSHVDFNKNSWTLTGRKTGFILRSGAIDEDTNIRTASKLDEAMSLYSQVMDYDGYYGITRTVIDQRVALSAKLLSTPTKDQLADAVINYYASSGAAVAGLVAAGPIWMMPAEFAHAVVQNAVKAQMAYALALVYDKPPADIDEFRHDLYLLFGDDDIQMTLCDFAMEAVSAVTQEVLTKESVLTMVRDSKAFQKTVMKIAPKKVAARLSVKGIAKNLPRVASLIGVAFTAKEARDFGAQAKMYYGEGGMSWDSNLSASGLLAIPARVIGWGGDKLGNVIDWGKDLIFAGTRDLQGDWVDEENGKVITIKNKTATIKSFGPDPSALTLDAMHKRITRVGDVEIRKITPDNGTLFEWTGEARVFTFDTSARNVATGFEWAKITLNLSDEQTLKYTITNSRDNSSSSGTYTRLGNASSGGGTPAEEPAIKVVMKKVSIQNNTGAAIAVVEVKYGTGWSQVLTRNVRNGQTVTANFTPGTYDLRVRTMTKYPGGETFQKKAVVVRDDTTVVFTGGDLSGTTREEYQAFIQERCEFNNPAAVWRAMDTHDDADSLYRVWAESYPNIAYRRYPYPRPSNKTDQEIIQAQCRFTSPQEVWDAADKHGYTADLLRVWADSYYKEDGFLGGAVGIIRVVKDIIPGGGGDDTPASGDDTLASGGNTPAPTPEPTPAPTPAPAPASGGPMTWTAVADSTFGTDSIDAIAYGDGKFVAVGDNKIAYSTDGASWTAISNSTFRQWEFESIAYGDGKFVAGASTLGGGKIAYSADGINWTVAADSGFGTSLSIRDIAYGGGRFVAVGNRRMANSTNGISWTSVMDTGISSGWEIYGVAYGGGRFVAGGNHGGMTYSADGTNWTAVSKSPFAPLDMMDIAYGGGRFVAGGGFGTMAYSTDGATWTVGADGIFGEMGLFDAIAFGNGRFVAGGTSTGGKIAYSTNGISWTAVTNHPFGSSRIYDIAYGGGRFVAVGTGGKMAYANW
jgi:hypothetical protein